MHFKVVLRKLVKTMVCFTILRQSSWYCFLKLWRCKTMGDFMADKNQKRSIFDSFKFWGHRPKHRDSQSAVIEKSPTITIEDAATNSTTEEKRNELIPNSLRLYETISGNYIISRGWDGNNMLIYKIRRKNY
jgi:hypothetical protein